MSPECWLDKLLITLGKKKKKSVMQTSKIMF